MTVIGIDGYLFVEGCGLCESLKKEYEAGKKTRDSASLMFGMRLDIYATHQLQHSIDALRETMSLK